MKVMAIGIVMVASVASADVEPMSKWIAYDNKALAIHLLRPPGAKVTVKGSDITIAGKDLATVTVATAQTTERATDKNGGVKDLQVKWTITAPHRAATCTAVGADQDAAMVASKICESIVVTPAPHTPHTEITVTSTGLADGAAYEKAVRATSHQLDACWRAALAKDKDMPEGEVEVRRSYEGGQAANTEENHRNFFDHDAKPLGTCMAALLKAVPAKLAGDVAQIKVDVICQLY